ncbi:hypothetical protein KC909_00525 [Candidatus Dojkabacteria bacterium]|uniref:DEAD/DEAH-box helicase domain-containing protein n=1 Tax=Candidatus Dojkabacteria bacterium TaxID=2099670 RepID=A0A955RIK8_9BACT|nr:hypothetical protein [Candidatus Dojkabacteria bacterium]
METLSIDTTQLLDYDPAASPEVNIQRSLAYDTLSDMVATNDCTLLTGELGSGKTLVASIVLRDMAAQNGSRAFMASPFRDLAIGTINSLGWACDSVEGIDLHIGGINNATETTRLEIGTTRIIWNDLVANFDEYCTAEVPFYSTIFFDETHTNTVELYMSLGLLDSVNYIRGQSGLPPVKVVLGSGTPNKGLYEHYSREGNVLNLEGTPHELNMNLLDNNSQNSAGRAFRSGDYTGVVEDAAGIAAGMLEDGPVLSFMPGLGEINHFLKTLKVLGIDMRQYGYMVVTGSTDPREKEGLFTEGPGLIIGTSTLINGVNLPQVAHVLDLGIQRTALYRVKQNHTQLKDSVKPNDLVIQGANRAGRSQPGNAVVMQTANEYKAAPANNHAAIISDDIRPYMAAVMRLGFDSEEFVRNLPGLGEVISGLQHFGKRLDSLLDSLVELGFITTQGGEYQLTFDGEIYTDVNFSKPEAARLFIDGMRESNGYHRGTTAIAALMDRDRHFFSGSPLAVSTLEGLASVWNTYIAQGDVAARYAFAEQNGLIFQNWENAVAIIEGANAVYPEAEIGLPEIDMSPEFLDFFNPLYVTAFHKGLMINRRRGEYTQAGAGVNYRALGIPKNHMRERFLISPACIILPDKQNMILSSVHPVTLQDIWKSNIPGLRRSGKGGTKTFIRVASQGRDIRIN